MQLHRVFQPGLVCLAATTVVLACDGGGCARGAAPASGGVTAPSPCTGPARPGDQDSTTVPTGPLTDEQRAAALGAVEAKAQELWGQGASGDAFNQAMVHWLQSRSEFAAAGVDEGTSTVWGHFDDGRLLLVVNNRMPEPPTGNTAATTTRAAATRAALMAAEATELPLPTQVRLLHAFGGGFPQLQAPIQEMTPWFTDAGYTVASGTEGDARVSTLRNVSGDGFLYFNTHGGAGPSPRSPGETLFAMWTTTVQDSVVNRFPDFKEDLDSLRLIYMTAPTGVWTGSDQMGWKMVVETHYAITHRFVERYMSFGANSVLYFSVCHSAGPSAAAFIAATHTKGAGVYLGWTDVVTDAASFPAVRYLVDRLLGANQERPENPRQRPFPWPDVLEDMRQKGLTTVPANGAELVAKPSAQAGPLVGLLAPSIQYLGVIEGDNVLHAYGLFGQDPRPEGALTITDGSGEIVLNIKTWTPTEITADIPGSGPGSRGDVVVTVRGHRSNPRRLVGWQGTLVYTLDDLGSLTQRIEMDVNVRVDPASIRTKPGETPGMGVPSVMGSPLATARYAFSGSYTETEGSCTTQYSWTDSGTLTDWDPGTGGDILGYNHFALVDPRPGHMELVLHFWLDAPYTTNAAEHCDDGYSGTYTIGGQFSIASGLLPDNRLHIPLDASLNVAPGQVQATVESRRDGTMSATATIAWGAMTATPAFDPQQPR